MIVVSVADSGVDADVRSHRGEQAPMGTRVLPVRIAVGKVIACCSG